MYERFYELRERPFSRQSMPGDVYPSRGHAEALAALRQALANRARVIVLTGESGAGKTTILQTLFRTLDRQTGVGQAVGPKPETRQLLVVDDAHKVTMSVLDQLRVLAERERLAARPLQLVLAGQPALQDLLDSPGLELLRSAIGVHHYLRPLDADETAAYVNHRLRQAALGPPLEFSRDVTDAIHAHSRGIPRSVEVTCDAILVFGFAEQQRLIDAALARQAVGELELTGRQAQSFRNRFVSRQM